MPERILNAGCGSDTYGTDFIDKYPRDSTVKEWDADKDKMPFPDSTFDEVYSSNLFEHLTNPILFLKECYRVLKPGGKIVLITDNVHCWYWYFNKHINVVRLGEEDRHYFFVNKHHLWGWFKKVGFLVDSIEFVKDDYEGSSILLKPLKMVINAFLPDKIACPRIRIEGSKYQNSKEVGE